MLIFKPALTSFQKSHRLDEVPQWNLILLPLMTWLVFPRPVWSQTCHHPDKETDFKSVWGGGGGGRRVLFFKCLISLHVQFKQMLPTGMHVRMVKGYKEMVIKIILTRWFIFVNATSDRQANINLIKVNWNVAAKGGLQKRMANGSVWTELAWTISVWFKEAGFFFPS